MLVGKEIRIKLPHIELAALEYGEEEGEPVLAIHGWLDNAMSFARLNPKLKGMKIIAIDLMGHGFSEHKAAGTGYQLWEAVFVAVEVIEYFGWKRCSLLGHSLGAIISVMIASVRPDKINRLMLIDGLFAVYKESSKFPEQLQKSMVGFAKSLQQISSPVVYPTLDDIIKRRQQGLVHISHEAARILMERGAKAVEGGYCWRSDSQLMIPSPFPLTKEAAWSYVYNVSCPINLIIAKQGLLIGFEDSMDRIAQLPNCQIKIVEGRHHLHLESEQAAEDIANYFNLRNKNNRVLI